MNTPSSLSRREWFGQLSLPVLAASFGAGLLPASARAATTSDDRLAGARVYNIRDFGAVGDSTTLDTAALQQAIDACNRDGGGTALVPAGITNPTTASGRSRITAASGASA